jgi:CheY-like chemotaxis protein
MTRVTAAAPIVSRQTPAPALRALVVDDEAPIRRVLRRYLERLGWSVDEAPDGASAQDALFGSERFDLVICDLNLPDCRGLDLRQLLQRHDPELAQRFVLSTGESREGGNGGLSIAEARELVARGRLLSKPFSLDELGDLLREVGHSLAA